MAAGGEDAAAMVRTTEETGSGQGTFAAGADTASGRTGAGITGTADISSGRTGTGFMGGDMFSSAESCASEENPAAVTEEELEALLKEFLTS